MTFRAFMRLRSIQDRRRVGEVRERLKRLAEISAPDVIIEADRQRLASLVWHQRCYAVTGVYLRHGWREIEMWWAQVSSWGSYRQLRKASRALLDAQLLASWLGRLNADQYDIEEAQAAAQVMRELLAESISEFVNRRDAGVVLNVKGRDIAPQVTGRQVIAIVTAFACLITMVLALIAVGAWIPWGACGAACLAGVCVGRLSRSLS